MEKTLTPIPDEHRLIAQAVDNPQAFATIYNHYFPRIFTYIRYRVDDDQTADDLTAFVFHRAISQLHKYQSDRAPLSAWLFGIARNAVGNHHRRLRRWQWLPLSFAGERPDDALPPEEAVLRDEAQEQLLQAVSRLSDRERDLIALKFVSGMTNRAIAQLTSLTESNVGVILHRALQKLRVELKEVSDE